MTQNASSNAVCRPTNKGGKFIVAVTSMDLEHRRMRELDALEKRRKGRRGQPPKVPRLHFAFTYVGHLMAQGVPFSTDGNSEMGKQVREWLCECAHRARRSGVTRKNTIKPPEPDTVRDLLRKIAPLIKPL